MIFESCDHAKTRVVVAVAAVVTRRVAMAPHNVIDDRTRLASVEFLIAFGALALLRVILGGGELEFLGLISLFDLPAFLGVDFEEESHNVNDVRKQRSDDRQFG